MNGPETNLYIEMLLEKVMIRKSQEEPDVDHESYEEIRAIHDNIIENHGDAFEQLS